ncbi:S-type pyocin domain-containing protein [Pseudomonas putida]|uniref:S-type pyocin domain-containing protein n=1 Tax=Pseudomonas sp. BNK-15 TaxID=3376152 RepID=UPI000E6ACD1E
MTARRTITNPELDEIYSSAPFDYNFETLLSWKQPFTIPITPPDITALTDNALLESAESIAQNVINSIEASCPAGEPGLATYLEKQYLDIDLTHSETAGKLFAKKALLLLLYSEIRRQAGQHTDLYNGIHVYAPNDQTLAQFFEVTAYVYIEEESEFFIIEEALYKLAISLTAAQIEIVLKRCLKKVLRELEKTHHTATSVLQNRNQERPHSNTIILTTNPTIQLGTTQGPIAISRYIEFGLKYAGRRLINMAEAAALRIFRLGIGGVLYSPELGNSDLYHDSALSIPAELLIPDLPENLNELATTEGLLESPLRIHTDLDTYILTRHLSTADAAHQIPVRALIFDEASNSYVSVPSRDFPIRLTFPIHVAGGSSTTSPGIPVKPNPYKGVNLETASSAATPFPANEPQNPRDCIYCFPVESGLPPLYIVFNSPYPGATTIGTYSGRAYNPDKAGGPIERLDWREATINQTGVDLVKLHVSRFEPSDANDIMIDRLEKILQGTSQATDTDKRFYTHETRELERFRALGIPDKIRPSDVGEVWNNTHTATLEDYQLTSEPELLYTPEAIEADNQQIARENK